MSETAVKTTVITPVGVGCFVFLARPQPSMNPGGEPSYAITLVFPKSVDLSPLKAAAKAAAAKKWGNKMPPNLRSPFRDGDVDKPDDPTFKGAMFITARTKQRPGVVGRDLQPLDNVELDAYSGMRCRASLTAFAYDQAGNKGVSFALNNVQKVGDGDRLAGRKPADAEFAAAPALPDEPAAAPGAADNDMFG